MTNVYGIKLSTQNDVHLNNESNNSVLNQQFSNHLSELHTPQTTVDFNQIIRMQSADPYLNIIKKYLMKDDQHSLYNQLPHKMKSDLLTQRYHCINHVLYYQCNSNFLIVLPPTKQFYAIYPLKPDIYNIITDKQQDAKDERKSFYDSCNACYKCGETTHTANHCCYSADTMAIATNNRWICTYCGQMNYNHHVCAVCNQSRHPPIGEYENESAEIQRYNSSSSSYSASPPTVTIQEKNGTVFYSQIGHRLDDYRCLNVSPDNFTYNVLQQTLVIGECDFSFSTAVIGKRGDTGGNMLITAWYYYKNQWYKRIAKNIGSKAFSCFIYNLKLCKNKGAKITFGIDGRSLKLSETKWNKTNSKGFDVIIFTLPRVYDEKWSKIRYNKENESMLVKVLASTKDYLNKNGEIHMLLLKGQFFNWMMKRILDTLNLHIAYWCEMDQIMLSTHFNGYIPRDYYGNPMKLDDYNFHFCSFKCKSN